MSQEAGRLLDGERGYVRLKTLHKMLRMRIQYMVAQVSSLYPVKASTSQKHVEKFDSSSTVNRSGNFCITWTVTVVNIPFNLFRASPMQCEYIY